MAPLTQAFARTMGSLPPLIPKPDAQPDAAPGPIQMPSDAMPAVTPSAAPKVAFQALDPTSPTSDPQLLMQEALQRRLGADYSKDIHPWGTPENHPGFWGKVGHALNVATGGVNRRGFEEMGLEKRLQQMLSQGTEDKLREAQTGEVPVRKGLEAAQTENLEHPNLQPLPTETGYEAYNPKSGAVTPIKGERGQPLTPYVKPGPLQHVVLQDANGRPSIGFVDPSRGITYGADGQIIPNPVPFEKPSAPQHITVMHDGQPHIMGADATGNFTRDLGIAPPNYAQMLPNVLETKTTQLLGPDNVMHRYQYNAKTGAYDIDMGPAPTGTAAHQIFQGAAIEQLAPEIISDINANRAILGNMQSYYKEWLAGTPVSDPNAAKLMTELMSFAAMQPALHQFRSKNALDAFEKMIGGLSKNPDATIATIEGILKTPEAFTSIAKHGVGAGRPAESERQWTAPEGAPAAPKQDGKVLYDEHGAVVAKSQGGKWVQP